MRLRKSGVTQMIIEKREEIFSDFEGTVIDIETIGEFNRNKLYTLYDDSRQYANMQQVILGFINRSNLSIFCAQGKEAINELKVQTEKIINTFKRPFYAFQTQFESGVWFHHVGIIINFDGELQKRKFEGKAEARMILNIPNYDDPFNDVGKLCIEAWGTREFDKAIKHNRACLLKERDILLKRGFRKPNELSFNK